jgi:isopenicillin-N N-acyltransferase-like protein
MRVLSFAGAPRELGLAFGETCRAEIHELYEKRLANAIAQALSFGGKVVDEALILAIARRSLPIVERTYPRGHEELVGIARGANLDLVRLWAMNALTDLRDVAAFTEGAAWQAPVDGEGCSSFLVTGARTEDGHGLAGQTWDLATDNGPHVVVVRRAPADGPRTVSLTTDGCLSLIGLNEEGIAVGTTNIRTTDARAGVCYLDVIHEALSCTRFEDAVRVIVEAPRAGAHYFYVMDGTGRGAAVECTARRAHRLDVLDGHYVHCNHVLVDGHCALEASGPRASSEQRQGRLSELLEHHPGPLRMGDLERFLADHRHGANAICRHDVAGISSNGSMILDPHRRRARAVHGPACQGTWIEVAP